MDLDATQPTELAEVRAAGEHNALGGDRAAIGAHSGHRPAGGGQPLARHALEHLDPGQSQRGHVCGDVARGIEVPVAGRVGSAEARPAGQGWIELLDLRGVEPPGLVQARSVLEGEPLVGGCHTGLVERGHEVPLLDEAGVDADLLALAAVEVARPHAQAHGDTGAALGADHAGGAARGAGPQLRLVDEDDAIEAGSLEEVRAPAANRAPADDHRIGPRTCRVDSGTVHERTFP